jgi:hypothetical protein
MIVPLSSVYAQNRSPLHLEKEIPLPGVEGRIDHFSADVRGQRLFVAALENGTVEVLDIRKGKRSTESKDLVSRREPFIPRRTVGLQQFRSTRILNLFNLRKAIHVYS